MSDTGRKLLRYAFTGGGAAIVDVGGFALMASVKMPVIAAAVCSFCAAAIVNFLLSSRWVFRTEATLQGFSLFVTGALMGLLVNVSITSLGVLYLALPRTVAKTIAVGTTFLLNFWINCRLVFGNAPLTATAPPPSSISEH
jgi:putative flippase GtrA